VEVCFLKKVKYVGDVEVVIPTLGLVVNKDDVIEVDDSFYNAQFEDVVEKKENKKEVQNTKEVTE
jgi:hypothetical protein